MYTFNDFLNSAFYLCTVFIVIEEKGGFISGRVRDKWPRLAAPLLLLSLCGQDPGGT